MKKLVIFILLLPISISSQWDFTPKFKSKSYYDSGKLLSEIEYKSGKRNGNCTYYYENGNKQSESTYFNGKLKGNYKSYYESGALREMGEYVYDRNNIYSRKNGIWKTFYKDGKLKSEATIKDGKTIHWKFYNPDGELNDLGTDC